MLVEQPISSEISGGIFLPPKEIVRPYDSFGRLNIENKEDVAQVARILKIPEVAEHLLFIPRKSKDIRKEAKKGTARYVAKKDDRVVGTVVLTPAESGNTSHKIESLAVDPFYQGNKIGGTMVDELIQIGRQKTFEQGKKITKFESAIIIGPQNWKTPVMIFLKRGFTYRGGYPDQMERDIGIHDVLGLHLLPEHLDKEITPLFILNSIDNIIFCIERLYPQRPNFVRNMYALRDLYTEKVFN